MIVVVANRWDTGAKALASRWASHHARILTCQDFSIGGWRQTLNSGGARTAIVQGMAVPQDQIAGVLTRSSCVFEHELSHIIPGDREYVAAEMTAFLWFWLSSLHCRVINRPTPAGLSGPYRQEYWTSLAAHAGLPVEPVRRRAIIAVSEMEETLPPAATVIVVGDRVFGETDPILQKHARNLAGFASVELLAVRFSGAERGARFLSADPVPDLDDERVATAVLERFTCN